MSILKDPEAKLRYGLDWSPYIERYLREFGGYPGVSTLTLDESSWSVEPEGELSIYEDSHNDTVAVVGLEGGVAPKEYTATNHVVFSDGQIDERSLTVKIKQR